MIEEENQPKTVNEDEPAFDEITVEAEPVVAPEETVPVEVPAAVESEAVVEPETIAIVETETIEDSGDSFVLSPPDHHEHHTADQDQGSWYAWLLGGLIAAGLIVWIMSSLAGPGIERTNETMAEPPAPVTRELPPLQAPPEEVAPGEVAPNEAAPLPGLEPATETPAPFVDNAPLTGNEGVVPVPIEPDANLPAENAADATGALPPPP